MNDKSKKSEEEKQQIMSRLKITEDKYAKLKTEFDDVWKKFIEKEKKFNELQLEVNIITLIIYICI